MADKKVTVIGAGLGGLAASIYLAHAGYDVNVFEKNASPGGKANLIETGGYRFDSGPSLLTMPFVIENLFKSVNSNLSDYIKLRKLDILCKYFFADGTELCAYSEKEKLADEISLKTADSKESVCRYLDYCSKIYELTSELFLFSSFSEISTFLNRKALNTLLNIRKIDAFRTMHEANKSFFQDKKTIQLFDRYATYNGSDPFQAPATLNIIQHVEYNLGGYNTNDGIYSITEALFSLAKEKGVKFNFSSGVNEIVIRSKKVGAVKFTNPDKSTNSFGCDIVISNADVNTTYKYLIKEKIKSSLNYLDYEPSSSAIVFYWGIKGRFDELEMHNIIFSDDYKKEFTEIFKKGNVPEDPTVYIYISSKINKSHAPEGCENWFVMINSPFNSGQNWDKEIVNARQKIISKINSALKTDIEKKIIFEKTLSPADLEIQTGSYSGSLYGISSNNKFAAFKRHSNRSKEIKGLYFCGGSVHPGGGIPLVLLSGRITAELIQKYE